MEPETEKIYRHATLKLGRGVGADQIAGAIVDDIQRIAHARHIDLATAPLGVIHAAEGVIRLPFVVFRHVALEADEEAVGIACSLSAPLADFGHTPAVLDDVVACRKHSVANRLRHERIVNRNAADIEVAVRVRERLNLAVGPGLRERRFHERIHATAHVVVEHARDQVAVGRHRVAPVKLAVEAELVEVKRYDRSGRPSAFRRP